MKIHLERYGDQGWMFEVDGTQYRTDRQGDGLWVYTITSAVSCNNDGTTSPVYEFLQVEGTCQFELSADRKRAYGQIRYRWSRDNQ